MTRPLNILFITTDQHRKDALGVYGNPHLETPNIDRLGEEGVRFENMFVAAPVCGPNRAAIATGRYPSVCGSYSNGVPLSESEQTLMHVLRERGYQTFGSGKMHFGPQWNFPPGNKRLIDPPMDWAIDPQPDETDLPWYGFDRVALTEDHRIGPYERYLEAHGLTLEDELHSASYPQSSIQPSPFPVEHHQSTWITNRAMEFIRERDPERPFFSWVSFVHPHHPFNPSPEYASKYDPAEMPDPVVRESEFEHFPEPYRRKRSAREGGHEAVGLDGFSMEEWKRIKAAYYGMISQIDSQVGRLLDFLEERALLDSTVILFTSDHGEMLGDHGLLFKGTFYDCVTNVPCLIRHPSRTKAGTTRKEFCSSLDLFPTMAKLAGLDMKSVPGVQGASLFENADTRDARKYILMEDDCRRAIRTDEALFVWNGTTDSGEFYDLTTDPECFKNLWNDPSSARRKEQLFGELMKAIITNRDPVHKKEGPW